MDNIIEIIGFLAAICTTIAFLPQAIKVISTKTVAGLSLPMYIIFTIGVFLWFIYGLLIKNNPIIIANFITFSLASIVLFYVIKFR